MDSRKTKQIIYGAGFIVFFALIISGIYFLFFRAAPTCFDNIQNQNETYVDCGGVCALSCEQKNAQPVEVLVVKKVKIGDGSYILLAEISNPNFDYSADDFVYNFSVSDVNGSKIQSASGHSFIYSNQKKYLFEIVNVGKASFFTIEFSLSNYSWKSGSDFKEPNIQIASQKTVINPVGAGSVYPITVSGVVKNNDVVRASKAMLTAFIYDNSGTMAGVSKTEVENLNPSDQKDFTIIFPKDIDANSINQNATKIYVDSIR